MADEGSSDDPLSVPLESSKISLFSFPEICSLRGVCFGKFQHFSHNIICVDEVKVLYGNGTRVYP